MGSLFCISKVSVISMYNLGKKEEMNFLNKLFVNYVSDLSILPLPLKASFHSMS